MSARAVKKELTMGPDTNATQEDAIQQICAKKRKSKSTNHRQKRKKSGIYNVPTAEELECLRQTESTFHSSLFKMQVEELMKELNENLSEKGQLKEWMQKFKEFLYSLPERDQCQIKDFAVDDNIKIPIRQKHESDKGIFKFIPPTQVKEIGSFVLETVCSAEPVVDVAVEIPKACWQGMDFLNHRYHRKRAMYLACIADSLSKDCLASDLKFSYQNNCYLKPVLIINPKGITKITVCVSAYPNEEAFKENRFIPVRNNVRPLWYLGREMSYEVPTPYYNATILSDLLLPRLNDYLKEQITSQNIKDGIILTKLWCIQRGLTMGYNRLNGFILTMFVVYLLKKQKINLLMNAYQVFRCVLLALQHENLSEKGITLSDDSSSHPSLNDFHERYEIVFVDKSGFLNLCHSVSLETFTMLKHEAKLGLHILDKESPDSFTFLFMHKINFYKKFEFLAHLQGRKKFKKYCLKLNNVEDILDFGEDKISCVMPKVCQILRKGLNSRILLLDVSKTPHSPWPISESPPSPNEGQVTIGFLLNPDVPISNLEKGPTADDPKAREFRDFWGDKSEMRRFQDGSIREAVYWPASTIADKRNVFSQIIKDILKRHANVEKVIVVGNDADHLLKLPDRVFLELTPYGTGEEAHVDILHSFNELSKQIRSLQELPLLISSVQGVSPAFHFSEIFPPLSVTYSYDDDMCVASENVMKFKEDAPRSLPYIRALKVVITFEGSGKWPDDVNAIKRVKAAFLLKIAELLTSKYSLIAIPYPTYTDVFKDGYVFRLELACHKEIFLMKQIKMPDGVIKVKETKASFDMEISTEILPKLNSLLHGLHQQHNTFGTACRLAKRWISSQLLHAFLHEVAVELLVAYIYVHPEPYNIPSSPQVAFIRFLSLIMTHDWKASPLIVNFNGELEKHEIDEIYTSFSAQRSTLPPMVLVMPFDKKGTMFTRNKPIPLILHKLTKLASKALRFVEKALYNPHENYIKTIFTPPVAVFDVVIYIKRKEIPDRYQAVDVYSWEKLPVFKQFQRDDSKTFPIVEFDPVDKFVEELKENFDEFAVFPYDPYGGDFIGVVWRKSAFVPTEFKASHANYRTVRMDGSVTPDIDAILEDFSLLGSGLIIKIEKRTDRWKLP